MVLLFIILITMVGQKEKIREKWLHSQRRVEVSFEGEKSKLKDISTCYLCGLNNESLMGVFQGSDDIGIISLLDWYIVELRLDSYKDSKGSQITYTNTGGTFYSTGGSPSRGMANAEIMLPDTYKLDMNFLAEHLCQKCLDKITESLRYSKWEYEEKKVIPLCIVDFQTLEIYSLQDYYAGCMVRDYWINMEYEENEIRVEAFYVPERT